MSASNLGMERPGTSSMSRRMPADAGQDVPSSGANAPAVFAGWMLLAVGGLMLANTAFASVGPGVTGSDWSFTLLAAVASVVTARGLWVGARWAWWTAVAYAVAGLFFVLPVVIALLFGSWGEPVGTGWDVLFFPLITAVMIASLVALWIARPRRRGENA
jgi:hypothetical protein